jgi:hypothetical protein
MLMTKKTSQAYMAMIKIMRRDVEDAADDKEEEFFLPEHVSDRIVPDRGDRSQLAQPTHVIRNNQ